MFETLGAETFQDNLDYGVLSTVKNQNIMLVFILMMNLIGIK